MGKFYEINVESKRDKLGENLVFQIDSDVDMLRVEKIFYFFDKFCVSEEFYYEFSMIENGVFRFYFIKQCKNNLNKFCCVILIFGLFEGVQILFKLFFLQQILVFKEENFDFDFDNEIFKIKISWDSVKMI